MRLLKKTAVPANATNDGGTHELVASLIPPPADWQIPFRALAEECRLAGDLAAVFAEVQGFIREVRSQRTKR